MSFWPNLFLNKTSIFGLKLWIIIIIGIFAAAAAPFLILILLRRRRRPSPTPPPPLSSSRKPLKLLFNESTPPISKQILPISPPPIAVAVAVAGENFRLPLPPPPDKLVARPPEVSRLGWGLWYTLTELETATEQFADENVIGEGGYGIVYRGVLSDRTVVAVKNLLNNRYVW